MQPRFPVLALIALLMTGCPMVPVLKPDAPADWPKLERKVFVVPYAEMRKLCAPYAGFLTVLHECSFIVFRNMTCVVIDTAEHPFADEVKQHADGHCKGRDHLGDDKLARGWSEWKAQHQAR